MVSAVESGAGAGAGVGGAMPDAAQPRCPGQVFDGLSSVGRAAVAWIEKDALVVEVPDARDAAAAPSRTLAVRPRSHTCPVSTSAPRIALC